MAKEKKRKSEEELERRRIARREKYRQIKEDPEKYAIEKAKKKEAYLKRKKEKKIKSIKDMSPREIRLQRKKWREHSQRYYRKRLEQKKIEEVVISQENEEQAAVDQSNDPLIMQNRKRKISEQEKRLRKQNRLLITKHEKEKKEMLTIIRKLNFRYKFLQRKIKMIETKLSSKSALAESKDDASTEISVPDKNMPSKRVLSHDLRKECVHKQFRQNIQHGDQSIQQLITDFYEDDINSRITPGKKQYIKKHGIQKQRRYLLDNIKNLHKKFLEENPEIRISYVTFSRLRPFWVLLPVDERSTCGCEIHTNINLIIAALKKNQIIDINDSQEMLDAICCDKYNLECAGRKCESCINKTVNYKQFENKNIQYEQWNRDKKKVGNKEINIIRKCCIKTDTRSLILKLESSLPKFLSHTLNILNQYQTMKKLKESLNDYEVLVHMDFSENYSFKYSEEVQSLHFGGSRGQLSLHTVVIYLKDERKTVSTSFCSLSECTRHDAPAVWAHLQTALEFIFEKSPYITTIHFLTDGPSSQYRNRNIFYIITQLNNDFPGIKSVTWNYSETGHGKGAPDGIGALLKRTADYEVKCGRDVGTFSTFVNVVREKLKNVEIRIVDEHTIRQKEILLPKDISPFKGTMSVHQVLWKSDSEFLEFRKLSCITCLNTICNHGKHMRLHKMYKSASESNVKVVNIIPENKRIRILSNVPINYINVTQSNKPSVSKVQTNTKIMASGSKVQKNTRVKNIKPEIQQLKSKSKASGSITPKTKNVKRQSQKKEIKEVTPLAKIKGNWENQTFINFESKGSGHEEFLKFISQESDKQ